MRHLDLFSGIGGFALAARWAGFETVAFCEKDEFCRKVLRKHWPEVVMHDDIRTLDGNEYRGIELLTGGFPCQPFSVAGKRRGAEDDRFLWPEMLRFIRESRPTWVIGENVVGFIGMALDEVLADLEAEGYETTAFVLPAASVGARHVRDRCWIVAYAGCVDGVWRPDVRGACNEQWEMHPDGQEAKHDIRRWLQASWSADDPRIRGSGHGLPNRMDRLKSIGNAIVPQVAFELLRTMATYNAEVTGDPHHETNKE